MLQSMLAVTAPASAHAAATTSPLLLCRHLSGMGCDMSILATDWFLCCYANSLPPEVVVR